MFLLAWLHGGRQGSVSGILCLFFYPRQPLGVALVDSVLRAGMPAANISVSRWSLLNQDDLTAAFQVGFAVRGTLAVLSACCSFLSGVVEKNDK
jgi:hypothetical protein